MPIDTPRGVQDLSPREAISLRYIAGVVEEVYKRFGFAPLETPAVESMSVLNAKAYGEDSTNEIFVLSDEQTGLRYDFTVPLARYVASNKDIAFPFKRYQIGTIWRKDEPQRMRNREFFQADVDIVGSTEPSSDAEVIAANAMALEELGMNEYTVLLNDRKLLDLVLAYFKVSKEQMPEAIRAIDKLQKLGSVEVAKLLASEAGIGRKSAEELLGFVEQQGDSGELLDKVSAGVDGAKEEVERMRNLLALLSEYKLKGRIVVDLSLARGLAYYTGFVWEFAVFDEGKRLPSVCGGGRYDNLIGVYSGKQVPATGSSLGISRVFYLLGQKKTGASTYAKVFIAYIGDQNGAYAVNAATMLRGNGVYTDINTTGRNLSKQLEYASSLGIGRVLIIGDKEREANKVRLRDMSSGTEELISLQEAIEKLK